MLKLFLFCTNISFDFVCRENIQM